MHCPSNAECKWIQHLLGYDAVDTIVPDKGSFLDDQSALFRFAQGEMWIDMREYVTVTNTYMGSILVMQFVQRRAPFSMIRMSGYCYAFGDPVSLLRYKKGLPVEVELSSLPSKAEKEPQTKFPKQFAKTPPPCN